jgi:hypothetical protein
MRKTFKFFLISLVLFSFSCDAFNNYSLKNDVAKLFDKKGLSIQISGCESRFQSRSGGCEIKLSADEVNSVIEKLKLIPIENDDKYQIVAKKLSKCSEIFDDLSNVKMFSGTRTEIGNGGAFSTVNLFINSQNTFGCLEVVYAYG